MENDSSDDDAFNLTSGPRRCQNIQEVIRYLTDEEKARISKEKQEKRLLAGFTQDRKGESHGEGEKRKKMKPIDMLKEAAFRRRVGAAFKSQTRD